MMLFPRKRLCLLVAMIVMVGSFRVSVAVAETFPRFEVLAPNVAFWTRIYSRYTTRQAVIHDSQDLGIVYDVIAVEPYDAPGARRINRARLKRAKAKYRDILKRLAADPAARDADSRRVAALFGPGTDADVFRRASGRVRSQLGQSDRFKAGLIRSGAYLEEMRAILQSYGVPQDLAYLPHVESSFNPEAYSKFGAAGIWQFTRSTGRRFMTVDYVMDERRDPIQATHAAAQLLAENFARLGSWPLAITAYNHGAAGMARAQAKHGDYPSIFANYRSRTFKFASRNFYAEFLAARDVAVNYEKHFGALTLAAPIPSHTVELEGYIQVEDLSRHFNVAPELLRRMNPALRPPVFSGQKYVPKGYRLRLPADESAGTALAAIPSEFYKNAQKPSRFYTVQRGDTAGRIARAHGVRLSDLILANNLSARATIYPNQTLRIPLAGESIPAPAKPAPPPPAATPPVQVAAVAPVTPPAEQPEILPRPPSARSPAVLTAEADATDASGRMNAMTDHTTPAASKPAAAETPRAPQAAVSEAQKTAPSQGGAPQPVDADQTPETPPPSIQASPSSEPAAQAPASPPAAPPVIAAAIPTAEIVSIDVRFQRILDIDQQAVGVLRVEVEETLGHYAEWAGVRTQQIRRLNGLRYGRTLHLHQMVKIPLGNVGAAGFEEQRYEYHKRLQEDFFAVYRVAELEAYQVKPGDNIWTLCRETFDVPLWLIKHYNMDADLAALRVQQKLMVPLVAETAVGEPGTVTPEEGASDPDPESPEAISPSSRNAPG